MTDDGVITGEKFIPPYYTNAGCRLIPAGSECLIPLRTRDAFDYTALQCIVCPYDTSIANSTAAEKVVIEDNVYNVNSTNILASVTKDADNKSVNLGIANNSDSPCLIRYFTYKEEN